MDDTATATGEVPVPPQAEAPPEAPAPVPVATDVPPPATQAHTEMVTGQGAEQLASMDDRSAFFFGVIPLVIIGVLAAAAAVLYFVRRGKNWNDLSDSMRIDDGDKPVTSDESFNTKDIAEMEPTKPSQRITELSRHHSKSE